MLDILYVCNIKKIKITHHRVLFIGCVYLRFKNIHHEN